MNRLLLLLLPFLSAACMSQELSPLQFTTKFVEALASASPSTKVTVKAALELQVASPGGASQSVFLSNAYKVYSQDPKALEEVLGRYVASTLESLSTHSQIDRSRVVPIVKDRGWLAEIARSLKDRGMKQAPENVFEDLADELVIVYAEDTPKNLRYLTQADVKELGLSQVELRPLAVQNLGRLVPQIEVHKGPLVSMITAGGNFEASLLTLPGVWESLQAQHDGDIVVAIPARDLLLVTSSKTPGGIAKLRELAAKAYRESSYQLTDSLFIHSEGKFSKLRAQ